MKSVGMIRRIDSLGRIVIPKEFRKILRIVENDMLEINIKDDKLVISKYSSLNANDKFLNEVLNIVSKNYNCEAFICDSSVISYYSGLNKNQFLGNKISDYLLECYKNRKNEISKTQKELQINSFESIKSSYGIFPIIKNGDMYGLLVLYNFESNVDITKIGNIITKIFEIELNDL